MIRQNLHTRLVVFTIFIIYGSVALADAPRAADRTGRATTAELVPDDDELLRQTAKRLDVSTTEPFEHKLTNVFGLREKAEDFGLSFQTAWTVDYSKNLRGGENSEGESVRNLFDLRFNLDTSAAFNWDGGTFSLDFQNQSGTNGSDDLGDLQGYDNADSDGRTQISELWYEQLFFDNKLRIKLGKVDSNSEFAFPENGSMFINSSFGHSPTIVAMPTYPDPSTSLNVFVYPTPAVYAGFGIYDSSGQSGTATGSYGPARLFHRPHDTFYIAEAGYRWQFREQTLPGKLAVGGHYSDGDFDKFHGGTQSDAGGFYANLDQKLWHKRFYNKSDTDGVYTFLQSFNYPHLGPDSSRGGCRSAWPYRATTPCCPVARLACG